MFGGIAALQSCGGSTETKTEAPAQAEVKTETAAVQEEPFAEGKKIYMEKCIVCHQANGEGIVGAFPPLKNSDYLLADKVRAVAQTLNGSNEQMVVNGVTYTAPMPPQVDTKEEAVETKKILADKPFILVTSAFHMKRSALLFQKEGLNIIPSPTSHLAYEATSLSSYFEAFNIRKCEMAIHEYLGLMYSWLRNEI